MGERSIVVDYDVCYIANDDPSVFKPGWYFWFLNQHDRIVSRPIGPYDTLE